MTALGHLTNTTVISPPTAAKQGPTVPPYYIVGNKRRAGPAAPPPPTFKEGEVATSELIGACISVIPTTPGCWKKVANVYNIGCDAFDYTRQDGKALRNHFGRLIKTASCKKPGCRATALAQKSGVKWNFNTPNKEEIPSTPYSSWMKKKLAYSTAKKTNTTPATSMPIPPSSNSEENNPTLPASTPVETEDHPDDEAKTIANLREDIEALEDRLRVSEGKRDALLRGTRMLKRHNEFICRDQKALYTKIARLEGLITDLEGFASDPHYDPSKNRKIGDPSENEKTLHPSKNKKIGDPSENENTLHPSKRNKKALDPSDHVTSG
jgi:hypothetical protein